MHCCAHSPDIGAQGVHQLVQSIGRRNDVVFHNPEQVGSHILGSPVVDVHHLTVNRIYPLQANGCIPGSKLSRRSLLTSRNRVVVISPRFEFTCLKPISDELFDITIPRIIIEDYIQFLFVRDTTQPIKVPFYLPQAPTESSEESCVECLLLCFDLSLQSKFMHRHLLIVDSVFKFSIGAESKLAPSMSNSHPQVPVHQRIYFWIPTTNSLKYLTSDQRAGFNEVTTGKCSYIKDTRLVEVTVAIPNLANTPISYIKGSRKHGIFEPLDIVSGKTVVPITEK